MKKTGIVLLLALLMPSAVFSQSEAVRNYIDKYSSEAVAQMKKYGIPASITLAQGILESGAGRSTLAVEGNNHFGIKCHSDWTGRTMYRDDDKPDECFRVYSTAQKSFEDHSIFLTSHSRYSFLFDLKPTDYKGWARGLKKAGYATSPTYADKLIKLIEDYDLDDYDTGAGRRRAGHDETSVPVRFDEREENGLKYIIFTDDITLKDVSREYGILRADLRKYNEIPRKFQPEPGSRIYLEKKKLRAANGNEIHVVGPDDSLWSISQRYGVRMSSIVKKNSLKETGAISVGQALRLR